MKKLKNKIGGYLFNLLLSADQFGNAVTGGDPDNTISAKVGYYCYHRTPNESAPWQWRVFRAIIDAAFYPVDGPAHCHQAYHSDPGENFENQASNITLVLIALIIIPFCFIITIILGILWFFFLVQPKTDREQERPQKVQKRLDIAQRKLKGIMQELGEIEDSKKGKYVEVISTIAQAKKTIEEAKDKLAVQP
ncbi:hypothetical protein BKI52_30465 [marine bacterium AO1-C]|nr:hypothetical protein BKI52_30465 [marine bacterium AO1-C]